MEKTFTVNVPDEIWVNSWNNSLTETYNYNGPATINVLVETKGGWGILDWSETEFEDLKYEEAVVELAVDDDTVGAAHWITSKNVDHEYTYTTVTNHDDSTYEKMDNPRIQDYFELEYNPVEGFKLVPIYKKTETGAELLAMERQEYVKKYDDAYAFDDETQGTIDTFLSDIDTYLTSMADKMPWKYVTVDKNNVPKIPASLVTAFRNLSDTV